MWGTVWEIYFRNRRGSLAGSEVSEVEFERKKRIVREKRNKYAPPAKEPSTYDCAQRSDCVMRAVEEARLSALIDSRRAWRMAGIAFAVGLFVFGTIYSFGVLLEPLMRELGSNRSATLGLYAISSSVFYFLGPATGWISDRFGPRIVSVVGALVMTAGLAATAFTSSIWMAYLTYGVGLGVGAACIYVPALATLGGWFNRWRTQALSLAAAGTGCGMLALPPFIAILIESMGWRSALLILACLCGLALVTAAVLVEAAPAAAETKPAPPLREALRSRAFVQMYVSWAFGTMALFVALAFLPTFATSRGVDPISASWLISIIGGSSILGRLGIAYVRSPGSVLRLYKGSVLTMAASFSIWLLLSSYGWLVVFAIVLGVAYGVRIALVTPVLIELFGVGRLGTLLGSFFTATGMAALAGPMLASVAIDLASSDTGGIVAAMVMGILGLVFVLPVKPKLSSPVPAPQG